MTPDDKLTAWGLIAAALADVCVVVCPRCNGLGGIGLSTLRATCPRCGGCGESTNGINIEMEVTQ